MTVHFSFRTRHVVVLLVALLAFVFAGVNLGNGSWWALYDIFVAALCLSCFAREDFE